MLLTQPQTPESMNRSGEAAAHHLVKWLLTISQMRGPRLPHSENDHCHVSPS